MNGAAEFGVGAAVGLGLGALAGWLSAPRGAEPAAASVAEAPHVAEAVQPADCRDAGDPDAELQARLDEVAQLTALEVARMEAREGRPLPWPADPAVSADTVEARVEGWAEQYGLAIEALDCGEYPCLVWVAAPGSGDGSRHDLAEALEHGGGMRMSELPLQDGRHSAILVYGDLDARRDRRTRWRERALRGTP